MLRRTIPWIGFVTLVLLVAPAYAQGPETKGSDPYWHASYWNNISLSGTPALEENVASLDWDWGYGSPHPAIATEGFSARWTRYLDLAAGTYRFTATSDDGIRVYVDGRLLIDEWYDHPARTYTADLSLQAGHHLVTAEYYEQTGVAVARLSWAPISDHPDGWWAEYFDNRSLNGSPVFTRSDAAIDFDWGYGSPAPAVPGDGFSVRWTRTVPLQNGTYRFTATSDDGIRVYVDRRLIIDQWHDHPTRTYTSDLNLAAGPHEIVVEYYENAGVAVARLSWTPVFGGMDQWVGQYFDNPSLEGPPRLTRKDENVDFDWGYGSPASGIPVDGFSVRWTRTARLEAGLYAFTTTTDDGVRLWVNGHLLIDRWVDQSSRSYTGEIHVSGDVPIVIEYYERNGVAAARLTWTRIGQEPPPPIGEIVVDDADPGFKRGGSSTAWHSAAGGYGGGLTWTRNNDRTRANYNWARWYPELDPGQYEVFVYVPEHHATTSNARYWVAHYEGFALRSVDQAADSGRWVSLGTYRFRGNGREYVSLADITYEPYLSRQIGFDAVKWVAR